MVGRARTVAVVGLEAVPVTVEAHVAGGLPGLHVIGAGGTGTRDAADRVRTALAATGMSLPHRKALVSLAPADVPKAGARFDLAMALALLAELGVLPADALAGSAALGELALDGRVRPVEGVLPSVAPLPAQGIERVIVARADAAEAALVEGLAVLAVRDLGEAVAVLTGQRAPRPVASPPEEETAPGPDLGEVRGQLEARRGLELAAAGGHHVLLVGPPGCGKSMLARRLPGLLPPLDRTVALELAAVRSVAGWRRDAARLDRTPPLRAPHHTASAAALLGGGSGVARPGQISLATGGVLFLDELFEWSRPLLESLREPLEEGEVRLARAHATVRYPARCLLACAANPCPCGGGAGCSCSEEQVAGYRSRLSGPLADRLDLAPQVEPLTAADLLRREPGEPSAAIAARVAAAREAAAARWAGAVTNAAAPVAAVRATAERPALRALADAVEAGRLTGRGFERALRVARTVADLAGAVPITRAHALEALAHRLQLVPPPSAGVPR